MSFIPSFLKSIPQTIDIAMADGSVLTQDQVITSVDLKNSVVLFTGCHGNNGSGFPSSAVEGTLKFLDATHIRAFRLYADPGYGDSLRITGVVLEFVRAFLRQDVFYFDYVGTSNHGLTLGPKAFLVLSGFHATIIPTLGGAAQDLFSAIKLSATQVVFPAGGAPASGFIVDPR